jgi:hypothetical protein
VADTGPRDRPASWRTPDSPYTVHADAALADVPPASAAAAASASASASASADPTSPRRRFDPLALLVGLVCLTVAVLAVVAPAVLTAADPRWVLAAAAVVVGGGALLATVRRRR